MKNNLLALMVFAIPSLCFGQDNQPEKKSAQTVKTIDLNKINRNVLEYVAENSFFTGHIAFYEENDHESMLISSFRQMEIKYMSLPDNIKAMYYPKNNNGDGYLIYDLEVLPFIDPVKNNAISHIFGSLAADKNLKKEFADYIRENKTVIITYDYADPTSFNINSPTNGLLNKILDTRVIPTDALIKGITKDLIETNKKEMFLIEELIQKRRLNKEKLKKSSFDYII